MLQIFSAFLRGARIASIAENSSKNPVKIVEDDEDRYNQ
jgi:hypothetical protein